MALRAEIHKALDIKPWDTGERGYLLEELDKAAGHPYQAELEALGGEKV